MLNILTIVSILLLGAFAFFITLLLYLYFEIFVIKDNETFTKPD